MRASATAERLNRQFRFTGRTSRLPAAGCGEELEVSAKALSASIPANRMPVFLMKSLLSIVVRRSQTLTCDCVRDLLRTTARIYLARVELAPFRLSLHRVPSLIELAR